MDFLSHEQVIISGIEFAGDVCYSGEFGQQVYTTRMENGGNPINGIVYELYPNNAINYYVYYSDGVPNGERVSFYDDGKVKNYCIMNMGTIDGENIEWYDNGIVKKREYCKYGLVLWKKEMDKYGNLINEKTELTDTEKIIYKKRVEYYEKRDN